MIDPVEALLAVVGVTPIISHEIEQVTQEQWLRSNVLEFEINKRAHELAVGDLQSEQPTTPRSPYMRTLRDLTTPYRPDQVEQMLESLPPQMAGLRGQFLMLAQKTFFYLGSQLPRQARASASGFRQLRPPQRLYDRFLTILTVLDDPMSVFPLAAAGRLMAGQVAALRHVLPTVLDHMQRATARELRSESSRNHAFQLPYSADIGVQRLLGRDLTSPALRALLAAPPPQAATPPQPQGSGASAPLPMQLMTHAQRTENL